jgi:hypothetical protein
MRYAVLKKTLRAQCSGFKVVRCALQIEECRLGHPPADKRFSCAMGYTAGGVGGLDVKNHMPKCVDVSAGA